MVAVMQDPTASHASRITAATVLDRGWGKPTDRVENVGRINTFDGVSDDELRAMIAVE